MTPIVIRKFVCQSWGVEKMLTEAFELSHNECGAAGRGEPDARRELPGRARHYGAAFGRKPGFHFRCLQRDDRFAVEQRDDGRRCAGRRERRIPARGRITR